MKKLFDKIKQFFKKMTENKTKEGKKMEDVLYISLVLTEDSKRNLINRTMCYAPEWHGQIIAEHHTIAFYTSGLTEEIFNWAVKNEGKNFEVYAVEYGISDKAFAVRLETSIPCANEIKHITVATNPDNGGKPVDSNNIKDWKEMSVITLSGYVKFNFKNTKR